MNQTGCDSPPAANRKGSTVALPRNSISKLDAERRHGVQPDYDCLVHNADSTLTEEVINLAEQAGLGLVKPKLHEELLVLTGDLAAGADLVGQSFESGGLDECCGSHG